MTVHAVSEVTVPVLSNVLLWDAVEGEWRIGHARQVIPEVAEVYLCACSVEEAHELITDGEPVPVFMSVTHWARLPEQPAALVAA